MNLKEAILEDAPGFLDLAEFGEELFVNGRPLVGCWDEVGKQASASYSDGSMAVHDLVTLERVLFLLAPADGSLKCPVVDQRLDIDGETWTVRDARPEAGIFKLTLYRTVS